MPDVVCDNCGGTDFYRESGYYYCNECQIQSQEIQEHAVEDKGETLNKKSSRKLQSEKSTKTDNKITSWECYNYILLGLAEELINLGADKDLKPVVKLLWLHYLEKLEVFRRSSDVLPKVQVTNSEIDAEIVYGKVAKRKRRRSTKSSSTDLDVTSLDSSSVKRERAKRKRALVKVHYDDFTQKSQESSSLHNETLTTLQTGSEISKKSIPVSYNKYASKELLRKQSKLHLYKHRFDFKHELLCHKLTYKKMSRAYKHSPSLLSLNKIYSMLYLGLLIVNDKIQLSDLLRFVKEGNLSFNRYSHLFPEEFSAKTLNFSDFRTFFLLTNKALRARTYDLAVYLDVAYYIARPNLLELCDRYCHELNLPKEFNDCVKNIISRTSMKMSLKGNSTVPNYEGRVLSIIMFLLKLLFGLDDVTEFKFGEYSDILNQKSSPNMFNIINWLKHVEFRSRIISQHHFPTNIENGLEDVSLYLEFMKNVKFPDKKKNKVKEDLENVLSRLNSDLMKNASFPPTLTPYRDYFKLLTNEFVEDFSEHSLSHVLTPNSFLKAVNKGEMPKIIHGSANRNWSFERIRHERIDSVKAAERRKKPVTVKLTLNQNLQCRKPEKTDESLPVLKDFLKLNKRKFERNLKRLERLSLEDSQSNLEGTYSEHYYPFECYWIRCFGIAEASSKKVSTYIETFPRNFQLVFKECRRIAQQTESDLLEEFQMTEIYLAYHCTFDMPKFKRKEYVGKMLQRLLKESVKRW